MSNITSFNFNGADVRQPMHRDIGFVYVVEDAASGRVKIGMSRAPDRRVKAVRSSAGIAGGRNHISVRVKNARAVEAAVHLALSGSRLQGEFFGCGFDEAVSAVQAMAESDAADDDYTAARKLEQQERGRSICDGVKRLVCEWSPPSPVSDQQKSRIVHARNFAAVTNSTLGDLLAVAEWAAGGDMAVLSRSADDESFFCFDGLVGAVEPVTVAAIYRAIAYAGQIGVTYGGGRDCADDEEAEGSEEEFTADRNGAIRKSSAYADHAAVAAALRDYIAGRKA